MALVDTNVLLDIATDDPRWANWSLRQLDAASIRGPVVINAAVYAEFSVGYVRIEELDAVLADAGIALLDMPRAALFLAGKVFQRHKAGPAQTCYRISSSGHMPPWQSLRYSRAILSGIARTFRRSR